VPPADNAQHLNMTDIMFDMYNEGGISNKAVSINSAFICMLHLANEQNLKFEAMGEGGEHDFMVSQDIT
jgi:hypothetical protein